MSQPNDEIGRKNPAAGVHVRLGRPNFVLLTVTTEYRKPWLNNPEAHRLLRETWLEAMAWLVGDYLLMPDHLHLFCAPRDLAFTIEQWITFWKRDFRRRHGHEAWRFQSRGWHHRLRRAKIIRPSGFTFRRIRFAKDWLKIWKIGLTKAPCIR